MVAGCSIDILLLFGVKFGNMLQKTNVKCKGSCRLCKTAWPRWVIFAGAPEARVPPVTDEPIKNSGMENQMIIKMYRIGGMSCDGCVGAVTMALKSLPEVIEARVQLQEPQAIVSMRRNVSAEELQAAVGAAGPYKLEEIVEPEAAAAEKPPRKLSRALGLFRHKKDCCR
jgi:copper chaperone CopZ